MVSRVHSVPPVPPPRVHAFDFFHALGSALPQVVVLGQQIKSRVRCCHFGRVIVRDVPRPAVVVDVKQYYHITSI